MFARATRNVALTIAVVAAVTIVVPSGAAGASEREYTASFSAPCVLGPGVTNITSALTFRAKARGPANVAPGQEFSFSQATVTITSPVELAEAFVAIGANRVAGSLTRLPTTLTNALPAVLNLAEPAAFSSGVPFEAPVELGEALDIAVPSEARTFPWGPFTVTGTQGQEVTLAASTVPAYTEVEEGDFKATGEGIIASISGYEGVTKTIGPLKLVCNAPEQVTFAGVPIGTGGGDENAPRVTAVAPASGPAAGGTTVTISGANFSEVSRVAFGSRGATSFTVNSLNSITAIAPSGTGSVYVTVTGAGGTSGTSEGGYSDQFSYTPSVTSVAPALGPRAGGTHVTISGTNFYEVTGVAFGSHKASSFTVNSPTSITAVSPSGGGTVDVNVTTAGGTSEASAGDLFRYGPNVTSVEPAEGPGGGGTTVTIAGTNFFEVKSVAFGSHNATSFIVNSPTSITAIAPPGSGSVSVTVTAAAGSSGPSEPGYSDEFSYAPSVTTVEPTVGPGIGGTPVTIGGRNLSEVKSVAFGPHNATSFIVNSPTSITAIAPPGSGTVGVSVTTTGGTSEPGPNAVFRYGPIVTSVEPDEGPGSGGTTVTIGGSYFYDVTTVTFGSRNATSFTVHSPTSITAAAPPGGGKVDVTVTGAGGTSVTHQGDQFDYAPVVTSVSPAQGPVRGGTSVTIAGRNFYEVKGVAFGSQNASSYTVTSPTAITAIAPAGAGRVPVTVTSAGGTSQATAADGFLYLLPGPRISAWGENDDGELGDGLTATSATECNDGCSPLPLEVIDLGEVASVATSSASSMSLALLKNGNVMAWGDGALGNGNSLLPEQCLLNRCSTYPVRVSGLSEVTALATDGGDSLALLHNGTVMAWGSNYVGGLGNGKGGSYEVVDVPAPVPGLSEVSAVAIGAGHSLALLKNGTVMAWGANGYGELGDGTATEESDSPVKVSGLSEVIAIAAGDNFSLALKRDGTVMAWGWNDVGELGNGTSTGPDSCGFEAPCSTTPVPVVGLSGVRSISAGGRDGFAELSNGTVMAWGSNGGGELGIGTNLGPEFCPPDPCSTKPVPVAGLTGATAVAAGTDGGIALEGNGKVVAWGGASRGQIGDGIVQAQFSPIETVHNLGHAISIAAGGDFNLAVVTETEPISVKNWTLAGSITPKPLGQAIALPSGSTFNGSGELITEIGGGSLSGNISVPPFKAAVRLYGFIPVSLGVTVTQSGTIAGTIAKSTSVPGDETLSLPVQLKLGFTSLGLLGLNVPTSCSTASPVSLTLTDTLSKEALLTKGWAFSGTTTIPKITCTGGLLGALYGEVINGLIAGAGSSYSLTVSAPGG